MKNMLLALSITFSVSAGNAVIAHEGEHDGQHGSKHNMQNGSTMSGHTAQNWQSAWTQTANPNYGYYQSYQNYFQKHPTDHRVLEQSEAQYHELLRQGRITQQEHAMLDAQLQAQHNQQDASIQANFSRYGYPYANSKIPRLLNKLRRILNY